MRWVQPASTPPRLGLESLDLNGGSEWPQVQAYAGYIRGDNEVTPMAPLPFTRVPAASLAIWVFGRLVATLEEEEQARVVPRALRALEASSAHNHVHQAALAIPGAAVRVFAGRGQPLRMTTSIQSRTTQPRNFRYIFLSKYAGSATLVVHMCA
jgi:hypothetical protein